MIYTKQITDITWNDVEEFCKQQISEGAYLDYKEDFASRLEKTISAMANMFGGIILIGIEENDENKPVVPIKGIQFDRGLSERVTNIILSNIIPPIFPEVQVCPDETGIKAVVVIRIPQSYQTPHAISNNTKVYLRTGNVNTPEELATIDDINWLNDNRNKSIDLKQTLYLQSEKRYKAFYDILLYSLISKNVDANETKTGILTISICPTYPQKEYQNPSQLSHIHEKIRVNDYFGTNRFFPLEDILNKRLGVNIIQDGVVFINYKNNCERVFYTEINSFGLIFYRQPLSRTPGGLYNVPTCILSGGEMIARIDEFIDIANKFYDEIKYWGYLDFKIALTYIQNTYIILDWLKLAYGNPPTSFSPDNEVEFTSTILASSLIVDKQQLLFKSILKLTWAFGIDFTQQHLDGFYKVIKR